MQRPGARCLASCSRSARRFQGSCVSANYEARGLRAPASDVVGYAFVEPLPLSFVAIGDQDGPHSGTAPGFNIVEDVSHHPARSGRAAGNRRCLQQQTGLWLPAVAGNSEFGPTPGGVMGAVAECRKLRSFGPHERIKALAHNGHGFQLKIPSCDAGLVGRDHKRVTGRLEGAERISGPWRELHERRINVVRHVHKERSILIDDHTAPAAHGHDVSFIGSTINSGMTTPPGRVRTKPMASATPAGSWSVDSSISGKRSSRNGVRIPPLTTAQTLIPRGLPSTWRAWLRPSSPHLLAWYAAAFAQARLAAVETTFT